MRYRKTWRIAGLTTGITLVALVGTLAGYAAATSGSSGDHIPGLAIGGTAGAAGICVGAYYLGKRADRRITTIWIIVDRP